LQKLQQESLVIKKNIEDRRVTLFIQSDLINLSGCWEWEMVSDDVFCSDVMITLPINFIGTVGIIHPEDLPYVKEQIEIIKEISVDIKFRIITTYGEIKTLTGEILFFKAKDESTPDIAKKLIDKATEERVRVRESEILELKNHVSGFSETITESGTFYINSVTQDAYYSDEVFKIYDLLPQSLNAHFNTFSSFIESSERRLVTEALEKSYKDHFPLHLQFKIISANGTEKHIQYASQWLFNQKGEEILSGVILDISNIKELEEKEEEFEKKAILQNTILQLNEQVTTLGYWQLDLKTRKTTFSDSLYRLFGLKAQSVAAGFSFFRNYVHPNDRETITQYLANLLTYARSPDVEYKIVRSDGKVRNILQKGKVVQFTNGESILVGIIRDVTNERQLQKKLETFDKKLKLKGLLSAQLELMADAAYLVIDVNNNKYSCSENLLRLLGYKASTINFSEKLLIDSVHPEDAKAFFDVIKVTAELHTENALDFRVMQKGLIKQLRGTFKIIDYEGQLLLFATIIDKTLDIEKLLEFQQELKLAESVTENIREVAIITDINYNIIFWNKWSEQVYKLKKDQVLNKNLFEVLPTFNKDFNVDLFLPTFNKDFNVDLFEGVFSGETVNLKSYPSKDGKEYYDLLLVPVRNNYNAVNSILFILKVVTYEFQLQKSLSLRLSFIERFLESSIDRIIAVDNNLNFILWNKKSEDFFKKKKDFVIGKNILEVFPALINMPFYNNLRHALNDNIVHIPAKKGESKENYTETYLVPVKDEKGEVSAVLWVSHDLSGEFELFNQQKKADNIINSINEAYIELDEDGVFCYVNSKAEEIWKTSKEQLLNKNIEEVFPESLDFEAYNIITKALHNKVRAEIEYFSTNARVWLYLSAMPTQNGVIVLFYDISEIKEARERLAEEHGRLKQAQAIGLIGSFEFIPATGKIFWSDEMYKIHGLKPQSEEITIERVYNLVHAKDKAEMVEVVNRLVKKAAASCIYVRIVRADGEIRFVVRRIESFENTSGEVTHLSGTVQDITEQKRAEQILDTINEGCFELVGIDCRFSYLNSKAANFFSREPDEILGCTLKEVVSDKTLNDFTNAILKASKEEISANTNFFSHKLQKWMSASVTPSNSGIIVFLFGLNATTDIKT